MLNMQINIARVLGVVSITTDKTRLHIAAHLIGHVVAVVVIRCLMMLRNAQRQVKVVVSLQQTDDDYLTMGGQSRNNYLLMNNTLNNSR